MQLDIAGHLARLALYHLSGDTWQRAKEVEARAAAPNLPLSICLGGDTSFRERITVRNGKRENAQPATGNVRGLPPHISEQSRRKALARAMVR